MCRIVKPVFEDSHMAEVVRINLPIRAKISRDKRPIRILLGNATMALWENLVEDLFVWCLKYGDFTIGVGV